jgi:hypothetical protein
VKAEKVFFSFSMKFQSVHYILKTDFFLLWYTERYQSEWKKDKKMIIIHFLPRIIACELSLFCDCALILLPIVDTLPQAASLFYGRVNRQGYLIISGFKGLFTRRSFQLMT